MEGRCFNLVPPRRGLVSLEFGTSQSERERFGRRSIEGFIRLRRDDRRHDGKSIGRRFKKSRELFPERTKTKDASLSPDDAVNELGDLIGNSRRRIVEADLDDHGDRAAVHLPFGLRRLRSPNGSHRIRLDRLDAFLCRIALVILLVDEKRIRGEISRPRELMVVSLDVFIPRNRIRRASLESVYLSLRRLPDQRTALPP